jgi:hypothetical protein
MARRVLFVAWAPFFSGAERALLLTLRSLDSSRYTPFVLAGTDGEFASQVRAMGIPCRLAAISPLERRRPFAGMGSIAAVLGAAIHARASLIHTNEAPSFQPAGYAARLLRIPAVSHIRFPDSESTRRWPHLHRCSRAGPTSFTTAWSCSRNGRHKNVSPSGGLSASRLTGPSSR